MLFMYVFHNETSLCLGKVLVFSAFLIKSTLLNGSYLTALNFSSRIGVESSNEALNKKVALVVSNKSADPKNQNPGG